MKKRILKNREKGITMVALAVTIIILVILAGVSIAALGENGLIKKAQETTQKTQLAQIAEKIAMDITVEQAESATNGDGSVSDEKIKEIISNSGGELQEDGDTIKTEHGDLSLKDIIGGNISGGGESIGVLNEEIKRLQETIVGLEDQINQKDIQIADLEGQIEEKNLDIEGKNQEIEGKNQEIENLQTQIATLEGEKTELNNTIESLRQTISTLETQVANLTTELENANTTITELNKKVATGNATASQVLSGATFSNSSSVGLAGTMVDRRKTGTTSGGISSSYPNIPINVGSNIQMNTATNGTKYLAVSPPGGYYSGGGDSYTMIPASNLGTTSASNVLSGQTFSSSAGLKQTGSMPNRGTLNWSPTTSTTYTVPAGYYSGGTLNSAGAYNAGKSAGATIKSKTFNVTSSSSKIKYTQGNGSTTSTYYATISFTDTHNIAAVYWQRSDISSGGTEYWMCCTNGQTCKMDRTNFILMYSYNGNDWRTKSSVSFPVSSASKPYNITVYYV